jgi:hypothetical protein
MAGEMTPAPITVAKTTVALVLAALLRRVLSERRLCVESVLRERALD